MTSKIKTLLHENKVCQTEYLLQLSIYLLHIFFITALFKIFIDSIIAEKYTFFYLPIYTIII